MHRRRRGCEALVATLGVEPQVITIILDQLLASGLPVTEAVVIYTESPPVKSALAVIKNEFEKGIYTGVILRPVSVVDHKGLVEDFRSKENLHGLLWVLYSEVR